MLPTCLTSQFEAMGQPRLLRPLCPNMLDSAGLPTSSLLDGIDRLFCEDAARAICEWEMPEGLPLGGVREDRWRTVSSLQKAIRRGDVYAAMVAAHSAFEVDAKYTLRRLVVCAVEDVMLGNLYAVAVTLALAGSKASRQIGGEHKTAVWLAGMLAGGLKDRSACNLCVVVDYDRRLHPIMTEWSRDSDGDLSARAATLSLPVEHRMMAAWLLAGTKRFWGLNVPKDNDRPRWSLMRLMVDSGMPLILYYIADRAAIRGGDCMFPSLLPIWQMLQQAEPRGLQVVSNDLPPAPMLGNILAPAYDMHTREGRIAIQRFSRHSDIARCLEPIADPSKRLETLWSAVFTAEGGKLNLRVNSPEIGAVHRNAIHLELNYQGLPSIQGQARLLSAIRQNLNALHEHRRDVLSTMRRGDQLPAPKLHQSTTRAGTHNLPILPGQPGQPLHGAPFQPQQSFHAPLPDYDPARADYWLWEPGDISFD